MININYSIIHVHSSLNNVIFSLINSKGALVYQTSCGKAGFKKAKRSTFYAIQKALDTFNMDITKKIIQPFLFVVYVRGINKNSNYAVRYLRKLGINVAAVINVTPIRHGGCKLKKSRRL
uniref:Ribosomal protein S11 n=1 Tax=Gloeochaete wittrockiana TaxID=38269 RepID=A0A096Y6U9_9EUKA|nr:ribosomal protein S11 [Gloeochaete wittrockiana]AIM52042.1 ribosomal protein S11 [Gloeochaete wittrockiana]